MNSFINNLKHRGTRLKDHNDDSTPSSPKPQTVKDKPSTMDLFFKKNITMTKQYILKNLGKIEQSHHPLEYQEENKQFKDAQNHLKEVTKQEKKISKAIDILAHEETILGELFLKYSSLLNSGWSDDNKSDLQLCLADFGRTIKLLAQHKIELATETSNLFYTQVDELIQEGIICKEIKEQYRTAKLQHDYTQHKLKQAKQTKNKKKEIDQEKLQKAIEEDKEAEQNLDKIYKAATNELDYQKRLLHQEYTNALRLLMISYKKFFTLGLEAINRITERLVIPEDLPKIERKVIVEDDTQQNTQQIFGVELITVMKQGEKVPEIFKQLCEYVEKHGIEKEGIFRISGQSPEIARLKKEINAGKKVDFASYKGLNEVSGLLKMFLRELPTPLVPYELYEEFLQVPSMDPKEHVQKLQSLISRIPEPNIHVLEMLLSLLDKIADKASINKMTPANLGIVFGMNIFRSSDKNPVAIIKDNQKMSNACEVLIKCFKQLKFVSDKPMTPLQKKEEPKLQNINQEPKLQNINQEALNMFKRMSLKRQSGQQQMNTQKIEMTDTTTQVSNTKQSPEMSPVPQTEKRSSITQQTFSSQGINTDQQVYQVTANQPQGASKPLPSIPKGGVRLFPIPSGTPIPLRPSKFPLPPLKRTGSMPSQKPTETNFRASLRPPSFRGKKGSIADLLKKDQQTLLQNTPQDSLQETSKPQMVTSQVNNQQQETPSKQRDFSVTIQTKPFEEFDSEFPTTIEPKKEAKDPFSDFDTDLGQFDEMEKTSASQKNKPLLEFEQKFDDM